MAILDRANSTAEIRLEHWHYPIAPPIANDLVELLRTEWSRSDFDWLEAMHGDYGQNLAIASIIARHGSKAVATATVLHTQDRPELALLCNVVTRPEARGKGYGSRVVEAALMVAARAGCRACFLGTQAKKENLYSRLGFGWQSGVVMRRDLEPSEPLESDYFRPGQSTTIRVADWGDLPGITFLVIQSLPFLVVDYLRGLVSGNSLELDRCVSIFPVLMEDLRSCGGTMLTLVEPQQGRMFGFGTVTIGPGALRRHTATMDVAVHDHYGEQAPELIERLADYCADHGVSTIHAYVAQVDEQKLAWLTHCGFAPVNRIASALKVGGKTMDVIALQRPVAWDEQVRGNRASQRPITDPHFSIHRRHSTSRIHLDLLQGK